MINPPNVTMSEPLKDMNYEGFYVVALSVLMLVQITAVVLFAGDRTIINKLVYLHFFKSLNKSYRGFEYNDTVSIGWNLVMQQFNCCGIYGYTDFVSSHSFSETWGEPFHSFIKQNPINFSMACCDSIEIVSPTSFQGPCRPKDYIHKRQQEKDQSGLINNNSVTPFKHSIKVGKKTFPEEKLWYPDVQKNNFVSTKKEAWNTKDRDESVQKEEKWHDGHRRQPMGKPNKSLVMDF
ncbi:TSPAN16 [Mytilus edulis]|uniref:TSPAN16 n=1 Tax=Mytilus edulis TaxID=6550 RepID=A0A8S3RFF7_MYTED|nr:TSPAN16 [Mytilus edulis]